MAHKTIAVRARRFAHRRLDAFVAGVVAGLAAGLLVAILGGFR